MRTRHHRGFGVWHTCLLLVLVLLAGGRTAAGQGQSAQETARRQFESGRAFLRDGRNAEALKDFESIAQLFPATDVADDALLSVAEIQLDTFGDAAVARSTLEQLMTKYPSGTAAPMAFVLLGRVSLAETPTPAAVDAALASFDRVRRLFPESEAVHAASYYAGETLRATRRFGDALVRYQRVFAESPKSVWAARARLGAARCLVQLGQARDAMAELQRVRVRFPDTAEAARALAWNTILYRLHVRAPAQPAFGFTGHPLAGTSARLRDIRALGVDASDRVYAVSDQALRILAPKGTDVRASAARDARGVLFDRFGAPLVLVKTGIIRPDGSLGVVSVRRPDGTTRPLESLEAAVGLRSGDMLVADRDTGAVHRVDGEFAVVGTFSSSRPARLAVAAQGEVAMLDTNANSAVVCSRDGAVLFRIPERGGAYRLGNPVDIAFDALGYVYVLDRSNGSVVVFTPAGVYVLTFTLPENAPGAFRRASALALDSAGRLLIADDRASGILVFQ
jgi:TolA-binding protein